MRFNKKHSGYRLPFGVTPMLKEYKRKFIMSNLLLVGFVLIVMNVVIFTYSYHTSVEERKTTISQKLEPYDAIHDILKKHPRAFDDTFKKPPAPPYEADNGKIIISLYTKGKKVYFSVLNQSTVIDKQDIPHIFERFYRSDKSRTSDNGHGLGLAIVKNLVEMINGKIFAESSESNGTVFTVQFAAL